MKLRRGWSLGTSNWGSESSGSDGVLRRTGNPETWLPALLYFSAIPSSAGIVRLGRGHSRCEPGILIFCGQRSEERQDLRLVCGGIINGTPVPAHGVSFLVERFPFILPVRGNETKNWALDELQSQFSVLQVEDLSSIVKKEDSIVQKWVKILGAGQLSVGGYKLAGNPAAARYKVILVGGGQPAVANAVTEPWDHVFCYGGSLQRVISAKCITAFIKDTLICGLVFSTDVVALGWRRGIMAGLPTPAQGLSIRCSADVRRAGRANLLSVVESPRERGGVVSTPSLLLCLAVSLCSSLPSVVVWRRFLIVDKCSRGVLWASRHCRCPC
ncbi:hypothetical protein PR048_009407 [Dryococelus australis]|uniref:Uncharacterized protein n=1 Tax=Dryococelus australis TaxID=614101 RepID=A0ABQ9HZT2_9NEOP|nr:hypothetical protein PR048_009407 [Dryococelus australis]